jgi:SAM-dependent methyltransferase
MTSTRPVLPGDTWAAPGLPARPDLAEHAFPTLGDPFGAALTKAFDSGGKPGVTHIVQEFDNGYVYAEDAATYLAGPEGWLAVDRQACLRAQGRVLDLGCGAGRHATALIAEDHDVVGLDSSPGAVAIARRRGIQAHVGSLHRLPYGLDSFDTFLMLGTNLGLLGRPDEALTALTALAGKATNGARLLGTNYQAPFAEKSGLLTMRSRHHAIASSWRPALFCAPERFVRLVSDSPWTVTGLEIDRTTEWPSYLVDLELGS